MKKSPEPIILLVALLLLAIGAGLLAYYYPTVQQITGEDQHPTGQPVKALKADEIAASLAPWTTPGTWEVAASKARLFQSDDFLFYPAAWNNGTGSNYIKKVTGETKSPSGIPLGWYSKYGLNVTDGNVDREDPDGDGFSNMTEFKNEPIGVRYTNAADLDPNKSCNPLDPKDHPEYLSRLRLQKYELRPFHIKFVGYQQLNGSILFQLTLKEVASQNQPPLKKSGDELGFEGYKIGAFHEDFQDVKDAATGVVEHKNTSTLELVKPEIGLVVTVPFRAEIDSPESTANFVMLMPNDVDKVIKISRGKTFKILPYLPDSSYLVISADDKGAKIRDTKTSKEYDILKLIDTEWNEVPLPPPAQPQGH